MESELVRERLGLTLSEMRQLLATVDAGQTAAVHSPAWQALLMDLGLLTDHVQEVFGEMALGQAWLRSPNPVLAGEAPLHYVLRGQPEVIRRLLTMAETGMPT